MISSKPKNRELSQKIRSALVTVRKEKGYSQKEVAKKGFVTQSELSKIENGKRQIDVLVLARLAIVYEKRLKDFIPKSLW